jgi:hypothetical protein
MKNYSYSVLIFVLAAGGACVAQSDQPSLADVAKQSRQEKRVVKVLTNDDVATVTPDTQSQSARADGASSAAPAATEATSKNPEKAKNIEKAATAPKDQPQVAELKQKLTSYQQEQESWKKSVRKYEDLLANETSDFRRQMYQDALQGDKQNVQVFQNKIDQVQSDLSKAEKAASQGH